MTRAIYMLERARELGAYRPTTYLEINRLCGRIVFEGVDGDELENTVTYWYRRALEGEES